MLRFGSTLFAGFLATGAVVAASALAIANGTAEVTVQQRHAAQLLAIANSYVEGAGVRRTHGLVAGMSRADLDVFASRETYPGVDVSALAQTVVTATGWRYSTGAAFAVATVSIESTPQSDAEGSALAQASATVVGVAHYQPTVTALGSAQAEASPFAQYFVGVDSYASAVITESGSFVNGQLMIAASATGTAEAYASRIQGGEVNADPLSSVLVSGASVTSMGSGSGVAQAYVEVRGGNFQSAGTSALGQGTGDGFALRVRAGEVNGYAVSGVVANAESGTAASGSAYAGALVDAAAALEFNGRVFAGATAEVIAFSRINEYTLSPNYRTVFPGDEPRLMVVGAENREMQVSGDSRVING